ncbi:hypothetical protein MMC11_001628 [Xylographa trunciseda]|nr:hypothetical protein [Xylographa trunciseda]
MRDRFGAYLDRAQSEPLQNEIYEQLNELRRRTPRVLWLAYSAGKLRQLHKDFFQVQRDRRRREKAYKRQQYSRWLSWKEPEAALFYAKGLHWLLKERPNILVKKVSERPSRFEAYAKLRAPHDPDDLIELRYRIGIVDKIKLYCGWDNTTHWQNEDKEKRFVFSKLIQDICYAEALPLRFLEQFQDIMNGYKEDPLGVDEGMSDMVVEIMLSEHELSDGSVANEDFWEQLDGSQGVIWPDSQNGSDESDQPLPPETEVRGVPVRSVGDDRSIVSDPSTRSTPPREATGTAVPEWVESDDLEESVDSDGEGEESGEDDESSEDDESG